MGIYIDVVGVGGLFQVGVVEQYCWIFEGVGKFGQFVEDVCGSWGEVLECGCF